MPCVRTTVLPPSRVPDTLARSAYLAAAGSDPRRAVRHGALYSENELNETRGISRTPVREPIIALARDGLLEVFTQRGSRVRELSVLEQPAR